MKRRLAFLAVLLLAVPAAFTACGGSDDENSSEQLSFTLSGSKDAGNYEVSGPESASAGEAMIELKNEVDDEVDMQLIRTEGDETIEDAAEALSGAMRGDPLPDWLIAAGGVGGTEKESSGSVTQILAPGTYFAFSTASNPDSENGHQFTVEGDASDASLSSDETVEAFEYGFKAEGLTSGKSELLFHNIGAQPHHLVMAKLKDDASAADVVKAMRSNSGPPPVEEEGGFSTAVLDTDEEQLVPIDLDPGRYALLCFVSDRSGGPPHVMKGMATDVEIE